MGQASRPTTCTSMPRARSEAATSSPMTPPPDTLWRTSSYSNGMGGECVEVAPLPGVIAVRDSKVALGPHLRLSTSAWQSFIQTLPPVDEEASS